jgi:5'-methylthioadenosine phosphorylase
VDVTEIIKTLKENSVQAKGLISRLPASMISEQANCPQGSDKSREFAILTAPAMRAPALLAKLDAVAGRVL